MFSLDMDLICRLGAEAHPTKVIYLLKLIRTSDGPLVYRPDGYRDVENLLSLEPRETINVLNDMESLGWIHRVKVRNRLREIRIDLKGLKK